MESQCPQGENIRRFLTDLGTRREELSMSDVTITNADYRSTILSSIPPWLKSYATNLQVSASVRDLMYEIEPDILIHMISEEYDQVMREKSMQSG